MKKGLRLFICLTAFFILFGTAYISIEADQIINKLYIAPSDLKCGFTVENGVPEEFYLYCDAYSDDVELSYDATILDDQLIISKTDDFGEPIVFNGVISGENSFKEYYVIKSGEGFSFSDDIVIENISDSCSFEVIHKDNSKIIVLADVMAFHVNAYDDSYSQIQATCKTQGKTEYDCAGCGKHIEIIKDIDPDTHEWSDWDIVIEATATKVGKAQRICKLCNTEDTVVVPMLYSKVYEPDTSWAMAATIAWRSDSSVIDTAASDIRPATAFIWLDPELKVYDRDEKLITSSLSDYLEKTAASIIPAFYIRDEDTAKALKKYLHDTGFEDCFVVSTPDNKSFVKDAADLLHVRGMLDFTSLASPDRKVLTEMVAAVNGAHGKVVLISSVAATHENVKLLRSLGATVWVQSPTDAKTLMTVYTNGVNGVLVDDYNAAIKLEEFFKDDAPTLLKLPMIIGHRGDPSNYAENTIESALGAYNAGGDGIENDIMLTKDDEIFIRHDGTLESLIGLDIPCGRNLTLEELKSYAFKWDGENSIPLLNEVNKYDPDYGKFFSGKLYGEDEGYVYRIPTLKEYFETFRNKPVVHVTEFKSTDPDLVPAFKKLTDEYDAWDQTFTITFERDILDQIYQDYPEISIGALSISPECRPLYDCYSPEDLTKKAGSPEIALEYVYGELEKWNCIYAPAYFSYGEEMVKAGRHRGLTVWLWTYTTSLKSYIAKDYLAAVDGMTTDEPWFASDFIDEIRTGSEYALDADDLPKPVGITKTGKEITLDSAEAVEVEKTNSDGSEILMVWRYKAEMNIDGENFGYYYLYSNPFVVKKASNATSQPVPTATPTPEPVPTAVIVTVTPTPTIVPGATVSPTPTATSIVTISPTPTAKPAASASPTPTEAPVSDNKKTDGKTVNISEYSIIVKENSNMVHEISWDEIPGASDYSLYIKANGKYLFVRSLNKNTKAEIFKGADNKYYISVGKKYSVYELDDASGTFVKTGTVKRRKIGKIEKAKNVKVRLMIKYTINGKISKNKNSYKVLYKVYHNQTVKTKAKSAGETGSNT